MGKSVTTAEISVAETVMWRLDFSAEGLRLFASERAQCAGIVKFRILKPVMTEMFTMVMAALPFAKSKEDGYVLTT